MAATDDFAGVLRRLRRALAAPGECAASPLVDALVQAAEELAPEELLELERALSLFAQAAEEHGLASVEELRAAVEELWCNPI